MADTRADRHRDHAGRATDGEFVIPQRHQPRASPTGASRPSQPPSPKSRELSQQGPRIRDRVVEEVAARGAMPQPQSAQPQAVTTEPPIKQTVFNDKNYVPLGATNVVPATRVIPEPTVTVSPRQKEIVVVGKESRISDFCPGGEGSIERRNCKAKVNLDYRN